MGSPDIRRGDSESQKDFSPIYGHCYLYLYNLERANNPSTARVYGIYYYLVRQVSENKYWVSGAITGGFLYVLEYWLWGVIRSGNTWGIVRSFWKREIEKRYFPVFTGRIGIWVFDLSTRYKFVKHSTQKSAKDAARNEGKNAPIKHLNPEKGNSHYHSTDIHKEKN